MNIALTIALRYLRARKGDGFVSALVWFALIGIVLGVATLIIVMSVMNGFRHDLQKRILGVNGHVTIHAANGITDYDARLEALHALPPVVRASAIIDQQALLVGNNLVTGGLVRGLRWRDVQANPLWQRATTRIGHNDIGHIAEHFDQGTGVLIGQTMAWNLGLNIGDPISVLAPQVNQTAFGATPRRKTYTVLGLFNVGMSQYDSNYLLMPLAQAQKLFRLTGKASTLELTLHQADQSIELLPQLAPMVQDVPNVRLTPWQYTHASFFQALQVERNVMFIILSLVVIIAAFNIIISQVMMVREKASSLAILRAVGTPRNSLMWVFFLTGSMIGGSGTLIGVALGVLFSVNIETIRKGVEWLLDAQFFSAEIYFLSTLPSRIETTDVLHIITLSLVLTFLASLYAAWQVVKIDPVKVLRHER